MVLVIVIVVVVAGSLVLLCVGFVSAFLFTLWFRPRNFKKQVQV